MVTPRRPGAALALAAQFVCALGGWVGNVVEPDRPGWYQHRTYGSMFPLSRKESSLDQKEPGWYRDPTRPSQQRFWDGEIWADMDTEVSTERTHYLLAEGRRAMCGVGVAKRLSPFTHRTTCESCVQLIEGGRRKRDLPGWYPDPVGVAQQRFWDGKTWTEHTTAVRPEVRSYVVRHHVLDGRTAACGADVPSGKRLLAAATTTDPERVTCKRCTQALSDSTKKAHGT